VTPCKADLAFERLAKEEQMPRVKGFLRIIKRRPGTGGPVDPDYGVDEGELGPEGPEVEPPDIEEPPGIWPPPTPSHPIVPVPPTDGGEDGEAGHLPALPPGAIWPRPPGPVSGHFIVLAHIPGYGWRYIVVDPDAWPEPPETLPEPLPPREPK
jgi:hypothetical protein